MCNISPSQNWKHLDGLILADSEYNKPGKIDLHLGVEIFVKVIRHSRQPRLRDTPTALDMAFGWVLAGSAGAQTDSTLVSSHFTGDDLLRQFWDVEEKVVVNCTLSREERCALEHFNSHHSRNNDERFVVPLPKRSMEAKLGESRTQAVHRFLSFERSIHSKGVFPEVQKVVHEYFDQQHAERVLPRTWKSVQTRFSTWPFT